MKIAFVLGTTSGGTGRHVRMLAAGCAARGVPAVVFGPGETQQEFAFGTSGGAVDVSGVISGGAEGVGRAGTAGTSGGGATRGTGAGGSAAGGSAAGDSAGGGPAAGGSAGGSTGTRGPAAGGTGAGATEVDVRAGAGVAFGAVEFGDRPHVMRDGLAVLRLRQLIAGSGADLVHAHGLRAGALAALAMALRPGRGSPPLVVTVHNAAPSTGVNGAIYQTLEMIVARSAAAVLCVSTDLESRMRRAGARDVGRALVPAPVQGAGGVPAGEVAAVRRELASEPGGPGGPGGLDRPGRDEGGAGAGERPVVLAAGRLAPQKGFGDLLEAARRWQDLDPRPLLAVAGEGPLSASLAASAAPLRPAVRFLGQRRDVPALLAAADVFVMSSRWEGQPLVLQEALRAGRPIVATRVGGIPDLTGPDAALLVQPDDPDALAAAVREVLTDPGLARRLADAARERARTLPSENDAVEAALATYRRLTAAAQLPSGS